VKLGDEFGFSGSLLLAIAQPSGFAAWLSNDVDEAVRRLPAAGFSARVELTDKRQTLSDLELILGKARHHGRIDAATPENARPPVFEARLSSDVDEAVRRLPAAGFSARVELTDKRQTLSDLELILGKARFHGRIDAATPENARPSVEMRLEGGELDAEGMMA